MIRRDEESHGHRAFALPGAHLQYGPDKTVQVEHIDLFLVPDLEAESLDGVCTTTVRALDEPVRSLTLDAIDLEISTVELRSAGDAGRSGVRLNGAVKNGSHAPRGAVATAVAEKAAELPYEQREGKIKIFFEPPIQAGAQATFAITYRTVKPRHGLFFVRPSAVYPKKSAHAWTQSQDENARYWFPCLDYPHEKQTTSTTIAVPRGQFALSNGALLEKRDEGDKTIYSYRQDVPHATYLVTLVVGPFVERAQGSAGKNSTPVFYYTLPGREEDGERAFGKTPQMLDVLEDRTGMPYPYSRYSQIAVSDFIFGGMENTTATTQTDRTLHDATAHLDFSSNPLVAHELAHQWFGDLLTCRDWSHAWLNEGFATFFEAAWRESDLGYDEYVYDIFHCVVRYLDEDDERYSRPIVCNNFRLPIELFDRHLYEKGCAVLHMLRGDLGESRFWRAMHHYVAKNAQRNVETIDFVRAIEEATGRNMRAFFDQWVFRAGHPNVEFSVAWDEKRRVATVTIDQKQAKDSDPDSLFRFDVELGFVANVPEKPAQDFGIGPLPGEQRVKVTVERAHETITIPLAFEPKLVRFDPGSFVLGSIINKTGTDFAAATLQGDPDIAARIRAARFLARERSKPARDALVKAFVNEPFWGVLVEAASALGKSRAPSAAKILRASLKHPHPKVRRAVAAALGYFHDAETALALLPLIDTDVSYFVRAAALTSLGKTRDARAFDVLAANIKKQTWNGTVEAGAARGLGELADPRATELLMEAAKLGHDEGLRRAAVLALGKIGETLESERTRVVEVLEEHLNDPMFLVQLSTVAAVEELSDKRHLKTLDRLTHSAFDGRIQRDAQEAAIRIREGQHVPAQVTGLRNDVDALREEQRKLQEKIEALSKQ